MANKLLLITSRPTRAGDIIHHPPLFDATQTSFPKIKYKKTTFFVPCLHSYWSVILLLLAVHSPILSPNTLPHSLSLFCFLPYPSFLPLTFKISSHSPSLLLTWPPSSSPPHSFSLLPPAHFSLFGNRFPSSSLFLIPLVLWLLPISSIITYPRPSLILPSFHSSSLLLTPPTTLQCSSSLHSTVPLSFSSDPSVPSSFLRSFLSIPSAHFLSCWAQIPPAS